MEHLRQIAIFAKTIDHGSFRAAAKALTLSPSVVSQQISDLEERLGTLLLYRSTRSLSLTRDGEQLLSHARLMLDAAENGLQSVSAHRTNPTGELRITMPAVLAHSELVGQLANYSKAFEGVELLVDFSDSRKNMIGEGYDLAIRMGWLKDSALIARKLATVDRRLVASVSYLEAKVAPTSPKDLMDWDWLGLSALSSKSIVFTKPNGKTVKLSPASRIRANNAFALCQFARSGAGLAAVPDFLVTDDINAGTMSVVLPEWEIDQLGVYAVWPEGATKNTLSRHLVDYLVQHKPTAI